MAFDLPYGEEKLQAAPYNIYSLFEAGLARRNAGMEALLDDFYGPSYTDVFASGGADAAAQNYRTQSRDIEAELARRGLATSGAATTARRGAGEMYGRQLLDVGLAADEQERLRKLGITNQMLLYNQGDTESLSSVLGGVRPWLEALNEQDLNSEDHLAAGINTGVGAAKIIAAAFGAAYGGAGGGGAAGALQGIAGSQALFNGSAPSSTGGGMYSPATPETAFAPASARPSYSVAGGAGLSVPGASQYLSGGATKERGAFAPAYNFGAR